MYRVRYVLFAVVAMFTVAVMQASAQDAPINLDGAAQSLIIQKEIETVADVQLTVDGTVYQVRLPVTMQIDTSVPLTEANLSSPAGNQVGVLLIEPIQIEEIEGEYEKEYRTVNPSSEKNEVVVYRAHVTNLHNATLNGGYTSNLEVTAIDEAGNEYDEEERICDDIDPGETLACEFIFDVPKTANLVDLNVMTMAVKRFSFSQAGDTE